MQRISWVPDGSSMLDFLHYSSCAQGSPKEKEVVSEPAQPLLILTCTLLCHVVSNLLTGWISSVFVPAKYLKRIGMFQGVACSS